MEGRKKFKEIHSKFELIDEDGRKDYIYGIDVHSHLEPLNEYRWEEHAGQDEAGIHC